MKTCSKWLIFATVLILIGGFTFVFVMTTQKWDFLKLSTTKYETAYHQIDENFKNITISADTADIEFLPSKNGVEIQCYESENLKHTVSVVEEYSKNDSAYNATLEVSTQDRRKWYDHIAINFSSPKIIVFIPKGEYGALVIKNSTGKITIHDDFKFVSIDVKASTGDICLKNLTALEVSLSTSTGSITAEKINVANDIDINVSTGKTNLTDISCKNLISNGSTGDFSLKNVISSEKFDFKRSTGNITFKNCDANEIFIKTDTGDVKGNLLSDKIFFTSSSTGKISTPKTTKGGKCKISTNTGNITINIP